MQYHSFKSDNAKSLRWENSDWLKNSIHEIFPDLEEIETETRKTHQKAGIDAWLVRTSGEQTIDYKFRQRHCGVEPDVALEIFSDEQKATPGWAMKNGATDWIGYVFMPSLAVWILDFKAVRRALAAHFGEWCTKANDNEAGFSWKFAYNKGRGGKVYKSRNLIVPMSVMEECGCVYDLRVRGPLYEGGPWQHQSWRAVA